MTLIKRIFADKMKKVGKKPKKCLQDFDSLPDFDLLGEGEDTCE
jgi:hypothetical protein